MGTSAYICIPYVCTRLSGLMGRISVGYIGLWIEYVGIHWMLCMLVLQLWHSWVYCAHTGMYEK